ncbi:isoamyl alcohol oxidase [Trichoderma arundinaceum]|uniref:Isoamyl alcohol oxidase n=1 Tax=Trichoderma arundinaceum TaxID=490622 RepID=A0A395NFM7_TRIAR|nr:isoamyl alcohol oxidase [Trichoderma arundinaceum]
MPGIIPRVLPLLVFAVKVALGSGSPILAVPSQAWDSLNSSVSGRLHLGTPVGLPCFTSYQNALGLSGNVPDAEQCQIVENGLTNSLSIISTFGSYHNPTFGTCMALGQKCTPSAQNPGGIQNATCFQGTVPDYYVDAREVKDIQRSLEFAQLYKLPVTIKNTGHDYKGRSAGLNTFAIWTHNIAPEPKINDNFTPESCPGPVGPVVTYGAGQVGTNLYNSLQGSGYLTVAGSCPTVGPSGGWVAGGGHGIFAPTFGLGVDNAVQMKVVLPNGTFVTANRCQNQDIFFALRGGGGGTFGVVTETTAALHKDQEFTYVFLQMVIPADPREMNRILVANAQRWSDEGWGGLYGVSGITVNSTGRFLGFNANLNVEQARASLKPVTDYFASFTSSNATILFKTLPSQWAAQNDPVLLAFLSPEAGVSLTRASRLVPRKNFDGEEAQKKIVDVLMANSFGWAAVIASPTNYTLPESDKPGGPGEASITPAWRDSLWHLTYRVSWNPADPVATSPEALTKTFKAMSEQMDPMRAITPDGGAYQNEADVYEPDPIGSFWGAQNYARLLSIKTRLDPNNLLSCWNCIGWNKSDERFQCYLNVRGIGP